MEQTQGELCRDLGIDRDELTRVAAVLTVTPHAWPEDQSVATTIQGIVAWGFLLGATYQSRRYAGVE